VEGLIIDHLTIGYRHKTVAGPLDGTLNAKSLVCLIGSNGLGKSTLLRTLAGLQPALSGRVEWHYKGLVEDCTRLSAERRAQSFSIVLTDKPDVMNLTAREVVAMGRMPYTGFFGKLTKEDEAIVAQAMALTDTAAFADRDLSTLSDGERQKVMIARAIAQQTPVMLLDEPTAFLDYESKHATMAMLRDIAHDMGKLVLVSTHDLDIARRYADRFITLDEGIRDVDVRSFTDRF
jgi:iron complex transport system ATP-binding protein